MERDGRKKCGFYLTAGAAVLAAFTACSKNRSQERTPAESGEEQADPRAELDANPGAKGGAAQEDAEPGDGQYAEDVPGLDAEDID
ncbi:MAG: hypothetical protein K2N94_06765, partial [Lachnospiraceae bacterium]|nr:hypothetical protein [Lachnospiraceae bacterium]